MLHNFDGKRNWQNQTKEISRVVNKLDDQIPAQHRRDIEVQKGLLIETGATITRVVEGRDSTMIYYTKPIKNAVPGAMTKPST